MQKVPSMDDARLHGTWLTVARITWVALALCAVVGFVANLPNNLNPQRSLCDPPVTPCTLNMLLPEEVALLPQIGLSLSGYNFIISLSDTLLFGHVVNRQRRDLLAQIG